MGGPMSTDSDRRPWSDSDIQALRHHWGTTNIKTIARLIDRSPYAVRSKACLIGLSRRPIHRNVEIGRKIESVARLEAIGRVGEPAIERESDAQARTWNGITFADHPSATRPEAMLRGGPSAVVSLIGCAAAMMMESGGTTDGQ